MPARPDSLKSCSSVYQGGIKRKLFIDFFNNLSGLVILSFLYCVVIPHRGILAVFSGIIEKRVFFILGHLLSGCGTVFSSFGKRCHAEHDFAVIRAFRSHSCGRNCRRRIFLECLLRRLHVFVAFGVALRGLEHFCRNFTVVNRIYPGISALKLAFRLTFFLSRNRINKRGASSAKYGMAVAVQLLPRFLPLCLKRPFVHRRKPHVIVKITAVFELFVIVRRL